MDYNTERPLLQFSEYGRGVKKMTEILLTVEDKEKRNKMARAVINTMAILNPQQKDMENYTQKLWDHLHIMTNFSLDIDSPYPMPNIETIVKKPNKIPYSTGKIRFRYYGKALEEMIKKSATYPEGPEKQHLLLLLAIQMKKSYFLWNGDILNEEIIREHIRILSGGRSEYTEDLKRELKEEFYAQPLINNNNGEKRKKFNKKGSFQKGNDHLGAVKNKNRNFFKNKNRKGQ